MSYPTILAGQRITAAMLQSLVPVSVSKSAGTGRSSTTTLSADPDLVIDVEASAVYDVRLFLLFDAISAADITVGWTGPTGATMTWSSVGGTTAEAAPANIANVNMQYRVISETTSLGGSNTDGVSAIVHGRLVVSTTAGTLSFRWAQTTSNATATNVRAGSYLTATRIS